MKVGAGTSMERTNQQQLLAGLQELKAVHDRHQHVLNTYKELENTLREVQVCGCFCRYTACSLELLSSWLFSRLSMDLTGHFVILTDAHKCRRRCDDAS